MRRAVSPFPTTSHSVRECINPAGKLAPPVRDQHLLDSVTPEAGPGRDGSVACVFAEHGRPNMRMFAQDAAFYRRMRVDETNNAEALRRLKELEAVDRMRERFTLAESLSAPGVGQHVRSSAQSTIPHGAFVGAAAGTRAPRPC